jgi:hypothetical protein
MKSLITKDFAVTNAENFEHMIAQAEANVYIMVGRSTKWANVSNPSVLDDDVITTPYDTTEYKYQAIRDGILLKKITANDVQPVAPRVDWVSGTVYVAYDQSANLFVKTADTRIVNAAGNGVVTVGAGLANTVNSSTINFTTATPAISIGTIVKIGDELKEVVAKNSTALVVNTGFASAYTGVNIFSRSTTTTQYSNKFYVRNKYDQVFKCLFNNEDAQSTVMPEITVDGQLPENPYIETGDGYKWKYLYTIPAGLKSKFFTDKYMPVIRDTTVFENAVDGRIDIIKILDGGTGYDGGFTTTNYAIGTVSGDGSGANVTVDVTSGVITDINILDGGNNYTTATFTVDDPLQNEITGTPAEFQVVISPQTGHGRNPVNEIGASALMIGVDFRGDVDGLLKVQNDGTDDIRQISIVKDPAYSNGTFTTAAAIPLYTLVYTTTPNPTFEHDEIVYVGSSYESSTFSGRVAHFDDDDNILVLNNIVGDVTTVSGNTIYQQDRSRSARVVDVDSPDINIFSGRVLYIENRAKIIRSTSQTETVKIVVEF